MWNTVLELLASKKALMAVLSIVVWAVGKLGLELNAEELLPVVFPLWMYILGQGIADAGKGKALAEIAAAAELEPTNPGKASIGRGERGG